MPVAQGQLPSYSAVGSELSWPQCQLHKVSRRVILLLAVSCPDRNASCTRTAAELFCCWQWAVL